MELKRAIKRTLKEMANNVLSKTAEKTADKTGLRHIIRLAKSPARVALLGVLMLALLSYNPPPQLACGPFSNDAVFTYTMHPDYPLDRYAAGQLGVLLPTYARSYLFVAHRYFAGAGFDADEQKALVALWKHKLRDETYSPNDDKPLPESDEEKAVKTWLDARKKVADAAPITDIDTYRAVGKEDYQSYLNCPPDAFATAAKTLDERISRFGAASVQVKNWLAAQDQVFANCGKGQTVPAAESASAPALIQADRNYQIAAANFYSQNFDAAEQMFSQIAADRNSPYRTVAPYLAARAFIRKGTLVPEEGKIDAAALSQAEARLKTILGDSSLASLHTAARRSLSFVNYRLKPEAHIRELSLSLQRRGASKTLWQDLYDYTALLDKHVKDDPEDYLEESGKKYERLPTVGRDDDMTDWLLVFQVMDRPALDYALGKWAKSQTLPWLVAALSKVEANHPRAGELIEAAAKVKTDSAAYPTLAFHSLRLTIDRGQKDQARQALDALLTSKVSTLPQSSQNLFLSLRMKVARDLDEMLRYAQRKPAGFTYNDDGREIPSDIKGDESLKAVAGRVMFDSDAYRIFNTQLPLSVLKEAATRQVLPVHLRREVAQAAWVKAVLLGDEAAGKEIAVTLQSLAPDLKDGLAAYLNALPGDDKKMAGLYLILKQPGLEPYVDAGVGRTTALGEIDNYRDNWWCAGAILGGDKLAQAGGYGEQQAATADGDDAPGFLLEAQKTAARREYDRLKALGVAPNYLAAEAVRLANLKPTDRRAPEILHLAVRATRYGCTDKETGKFSKAAYDLLHRKYSRSEWAAKTKYWFSGQ